MRISTSMIFRQGVKWMMGHQSSLAKIQEQISSGQKILKPSDDPVNSARLMELHKQLQLNAQYERNIVIARGRLGIEENAFQESSNILQRARELTIYGKDGALVASDHRAIAVEIRELRAQFLDLANTKDGDGAYLFSGFKEQIKPFSIKADGSADYQGDQGQRLLQIGLSRQIAVGDNGSEVFQFIRNGNGNFQVGAVENNTGSGIIDPGSVIDPVTFQNSNYQGHSYSLEFFKIAVDPIDPNSKIADAFKVKDTTTGLYISVDNLNPINPLPFTSTDNYYTYMSGQPIQFRGLQVNIQGEPEGQLFDASLGAYVTDPPAGDSFTIAPSENQDILKTLSNLIDTLENSTSGISASRTKFNQKMDSVLVDIDQAQEHLNQIWGKTGSRMNALDVQEEVNQDFDLQLQSLQSDIGAVDFADAATRLNEALMALQASQQSFMKVQNLSLFDYLRN